MRMLQLEECTCPDPWCPVSGHAVCGVCGSDVVILPDDPAFCGTCGHDVMPRNACRWPDARRLVPPQEGAEG